MENNKINVHKKPVSPLKILIYIMLSLLVVVYLAPLLWMINVSLKTNKEVFLDRKSVV